MNKIFSGEITLLKALAIMLVVSGHLEFSIFGMFPPYSFQLALFFFISGMLFKDKYLNNVFEYFTRRIKSLLIPYFAYEAVYLLITLAMVPVIGEFFGEPVSFKNFFITPFLNGHQLYLCAPLWFVPQLFVTMIVFLFLMRMFSNIKNIKSEEDFINKNTSSNINSPHPNLPHPGKEKLWNVQILQESIPLIFFAILGFGSIPLWKIISHTPLSLMFIRTTFSLFFVYLGYYYVKYIKDNFNIFTPKWLGGIICFQSILWLFNRDFNPEHGIGLSYVLVWGRFDQQLIVPVLTSLTGIWICLYTVRLLYPYFKDIKFLQDVGNSTYHIMANHLFVMYVITLILFKVTGTPLSDKGDKIYSIYNPVQTTYLYFVVVMLITTYFAKFQKFIYKKLSNKY